MVELLTWVVVALGLWGVALWGTVRIGRRRRIRSALGPPIEVDDERRRQLRAVAATDYAQFARRRTGPE